MEITSVERNKKNKDRFSVYLDGRYSFTIAEDDYISMNLYEKKDLSIEELDYIKNNLNFRDAKNTAVKYLSLKIRTENEVRTKLLEDGYDNNATESAIEELKAIGYINNKLYAQKFVFDRSKLKPKSKKLLKLELKSKGIDEDIIDEVLDDWNVDDKIVAEGLIKRKFGKYDLKDQNVRKKVYMFLKHRGYDHEIITSVIGSFEDDDPYL
jgi:Uncharacterized protein conserved in bacteria